jgi:large subunit ribosomal protein L32
LFDINLGEIMAVPKRRQSHSRTRMRRAHDFVKPVQIMFCKDCGNPTLPHVICPTCGYYMGRTLVKIDDDVSPSKQG